MIDHITLQVADLAASRAFYDAVLAALGHEFLIEVDGAVGYGDAHWNFGIAIAEGPVIPVHLAFAASSNTQVLAFYNAGLAAGGADNGAPGPRPIYGEGYFAAFIRDPDGHNIEAVCRN